LINTCEVNSTEEDAPPELEKVDSDMLKAEQLAQSDKEKAHRELYEQLRKNVPTDKEKEEENE